MRQPAPRLTEQAGVLRMEGRERGQVARRHVVGVQVETSYLKPNILLKALYCPRS